MFTSKKIKDKHVKWWIYQLSKWGSILSQVYIYQITTVYTVCTLQIYFLIHVCCAVLSRFSHVQLFATIWTIAYQAVLSMGFSRQEY